MEKSKFFYPDPRPPRYQTRLTPLSVTDHSLPQKLYIL